MISASHFEKTIKSLFWKSLTPRASTPGAFRLKPGMAVLALRPDRLGDFILSAPALQLLEKKLGPKGRLTLVAGERNRILAKFFFPDAEVLVFRKFFLSRLALFLRLRMRRFDLVVDFHSYPFSTTSAIMTLCPESPARIGFWDGGKSAEVSRRVFNLGVPPPGEDIHEMEKSLSLLKPLGLALLKNKKSPLNLPSLGSEIRDRVEAFYRQTGVGPKNFLLAIHPTLQKADNRWSLERYVELVQKAVRLPRTKIVVVYGLGEEERLQRFKGLCAKNPNVFVLPANDLLFILGAAKRFDVLVCNDSGLMHLAALVTRILAVFGPSDPRRWGPLQIGNLNPKIFQSKDHQCDSIQVSEVLKELQRMIRGRRLVVRR